MQRAAGIGQIPAVIAVMMDLTCVGVAVAVRMMIVRGNRVRHRLRSGARRRYDPRELRDDEQGDQQPDKPAYRAKPIHPRPDHLPLGTTHCGLIAFLRQCRSAIRSRTSGRRSSVHANSTTRCARSRPITGVALARNLASMAASLIGLAAVPVAWGTWAS